MTDIHRLQYQNVFKMMWRHGSNKLYVIELMFFFLVSCSYQSLKAKCTRKMLGRGLTCWLCWFSNERKAYRNAADWGNENEPKQEIKDENTELINVLIITALRYELKSHWTKHFHSVATCLVVMEGAWPKQTAEWDCNVIQISLAGSICLNCPEMLSQVITHPIMASWGR